MRILGFKSRFINFLTNMSTLVLARQTLVMTRR